MHKLRASLRRLFPRAALLREIRASLRNDAWAVDPEVRVNALGQPVSGVKRRAEKCNVTVTVWGGVFVHGARLTLNPLQRLRMIVAVRRHLARHGLGMFPL